MLQILALRKQPTDSILELPLCSSIPRMNNAIRPEQNVQGNVCSISIRDVATKMSPQMFRQYLSQLHAAPIHRYRYLNIYLCSKQAHTSSLNSARWDRLQKARWWWINRHNWNFLRRSTLYYIIQLSNRGKRSRTCRVFGNSLKRTGQTN